MPVTAPQLQLTSTAEIIEAKTRLLYCRGDDLPTALARLQAVTEDPSAERFARTTGIPLLDRLASRIGGTAQAILARYLTAGAVNITIDVAEPPPPQQLPPGVETALAIRFGEHRRGARSHRHQLLRAVLATMQQANIDLSLVWEFGGPVDMETNPAHARVLVDSGQRVLRRLGQDLMQDRHGQALDRIVFVLDPQRKAPWILLSFTATDQRALAAVIDEEHAELSALIMDGPGPFTDGAR